MKDPSPLTIALAASILLFLLIGFHINNSIAKSNLEAHKEIVQSAENVNKTFIQGAEKVVRLNLIKTEFCISGKYLFLKQLDKRRQKSRTNSFKCRQGN